MKMLMAIPYGRLATALAIALLSATTTQVASAAEEESKKHLDWDRTDEVWRCVGSPVNCDFEVT